MSIKNNTNRKDVTNSNKAKKGIAILASAVLVLIAALLIITGALGSDTQTAIQTSNSGNDLVIPKSEVTETAKYYPYSVGGTEMEIVALKASDGTVRTALNTCQICFDSGRGYYVQEGDVLICQNCGNRFSADQIEIVKGGCNPVPIMQENKIDDGTNITISKDFLAQNVDLFSNWKTK